MEQIIRKTLEQFTTKKREGEVESIIILKDTAPEALRDSIMQAHGDRLPDDWIYETYCSILETLSGYTIESADDLEEHRPEIVDGLVDVYTQDLTAWLSRHPSNVYYIEAAREEYGSTDNDGFKMLQIAQYKAIDEIYGEVAEYIKNATEEE